MGNLLTPAITIGPFVLGFAVLFAVVCIAVRLCTLAPNSGTSVLRFAVLAGLIGIAGFIGGAVIGIAAFCSFASSGNLCGLGGIFGVGPFVSGICIAWYSYTWLKATRVAA